MPSVIKLVDEEYAMVIVDLSDEENQTGEEKEFEDSDGKEKEVFFTSFNVQCNSLTSYNDLASGFYLDGVCNYSLDIQLPPPKHII